MERVQGRSTATRIAVCYSKLDVGQAQAAFARRGTGIQAINSVMCNVRVRRNFFITQMKYLYVYVYDPICKGTLRLIRVFFE